MLIVFQIIVLLFSAIIHEVSHGLAALKLGDKTAQIQGRLSLNPAKHLDPFGSIILPLLLAISSLPVFGYAKPVPYNPYNLKNPKRGAALIAAAGPGSNFILAIIFALLIRAMAFFDLLALGGGMVLVLFNIIVIINLILGFFNLIPIPPLDGSKILFYFFPARLGGGLERFLNQYGFYLLIFLVFFTNIPFLEPLVLNTHRLLVGGSLAALF